MDTLTSLRTGIVRGVTAIVVTSTVASTIESYMGLRAWAIEHSIVGFGADIFPLFIDSFALAGEGVLILAYIDHWRTRARVVPWVILTLGLAVSVALNVGQIRSTDDLTLITHGTFPVAMWLSLLVGTVMFKRVIKNKPKPDEDTAGEPADEPEPVQDGLEYVPVPTIGKDLKVAAAAFEDQLKAGKVPGLNRIRTTLNVGHSKAPIIQAHLRELANHS